jgi:hypothetical protein
MRPVVYTWRPVTLALALLLNAPAACRTEPAEDRAPPAEEELAGPPTGEEAPTRADEERAAAEPDRGGERADGRNGCGGTVPLEASPGWACGPGDQGRWVCGGPNAVVCDYPGRLTVCHHGRGRQPDAIRVTSAEVSEHLRHGDYFGLCRPDLVVDVLVDVVEVDVAVTVVEVERVLADLVVTDLAVLGVGEHHLYRRNACGGTVALRGHPGDSCGRDGHGTWECDGHDDVDCVERSSHVRICHVPPGNPGNAHNITVGASAIDAHLRHGDYLGECRSERRDRDRDRRPGRRDRRGR